jgi:hypothetical protein
MGFHAPTTHQEWRSHRSGACLTPVVALSGFLTLSAPCSPPVRPALFHAGNVHGVFPSELFPLKEPFRLSAAVALMMFTSHRCCHTSWSFHEKRAMPAAHLRTPSGASRLPSDHSPTWHEVRFPPFSAPRAEARVTVRDGAAPLGRTTRRGPEPKLRTTSMHVVADRYPVRAAVLRGDASSPTRWRIVHLSRKRWSLRSTRASKRPHREAYDQAGLHDPGGSIPVRPPNRSSAGAPDATTGPSGDAADRIVQSCPDAEAPVRAARTFVLASRLMAATVNPVRLEPKLVRTLLLGCHSLRRRCSIGRPACSTPRCRVGRSPISQRQSSDCSGHSSGAMRTGARAASGWSPPLL